MKPVKQERSDDCLPACIASLLELPLGVVQNYAKRADGVVSQLRSHQRWLRRLGWTLVEVPLGKRRLVRGRRVAMAPWLPMAVPCHVIVTAKVNRGRSLHALVGIVRDGRIDVVHDPSPSPWGSDVRPIGVAFLTPAIRKRHRDAVTTSDRPPIVECRSR